MGNFNEIIQSNPLVLVDVFATWCGPCKMMHPILEQLKTQQGDDLTILKVDIDQNEALARQYAIQAVPTLILFKNGQMVWRESGAMPLAQLSEIINKFK